MRTKKLILNKENVSIFSGEESNQIRGGTQDQTWCGIMCPIASANGVGSCVFMCGGSNANTCTCSGPEESYNWCTEQGCN